MISHWCQCMWQTHFALLWEMSFSRVASFCQSWAVLIIYCYSFWSIIFLFFFITEHDVHPAPEETEPVAMVTPDEQEPSITEHGEGFLQYDQAHTFINACWLWPMIHSKFSKCRYKHVSLNICVTPEVILYKYNDFVNFMIFFSKWNLKTIYGQWKLKFFVNRPVS